MPNWCQNDLVVKGMSMDTFIEKYSIKSDGSNEVEISFEKIIPLGEWEFDKAVKEWGTKWGDVDFVFFQSEDGFIASFDTAWSPPIPVIEELRVQNPDATFDLYFAEGGCDFCGFDKVDDCFDEELSNLNIDEVNEEYFEGFIGECISEEV